GLRGSLKRLLRRFAPRNDGIKKARNDSIKTLAMTPPSPVIASARRARGNPFFTKRLLRRPP
ncbi:MAG: hypothetical protein ACP5TY_08980, partial [Thermodesulforhabdaceae bacterium]